MVLAAGQLSAMDVCILCAVRIQGCDVCIACMHQMRVMNDMHQKAMVYAPQVCIKSTPGAYSVFCI